MNRSRLHRLGLGALFIALTLTAFLPATGPKKIAHYSIDGPFCSGCVGSLTAMTEKIDGVEEVRVDIEAPGVMVTFDAEKTTAEAIQKLINEETTFNLALKEVKDKETRSRSSFGLPCC